MPTTKRVLKYDEVKDVEMEFILDCSGRLDASKEAMWPWKQRVE